jgi:hypothetical protein
MFYNEAERLPNSLRKRIIAFIFFGSIDDKTTAYYHSKGSLKLFEKPPIHPKQPLAIAPFLSVDSRAPAQSVSKHFMKQKNLKITPPMAMNYTKI